MSFLKKENFVSALADAGYQFDLVEKGKVSRLETACGVVLLHVFVSNGKPRNLQDILKMGISVHSRYEDISALHRAVSVGYSRIIEILVDNGADLYEKIYGKTLLEFAVLKGHADAVDALISLGLDPNEVDNDGLTLLYRAAERNDIDVAEVLLDYGDFFTDADETLAHVAVERNCTNAIRCFGDLELDLDEVDSRCRTPIYKAAELGNLSMIKVLVEYGADILTRDSDGNSLLHIAARRDNVIAAETLLNAGMDVDIRGGWWEWTPLHMAVKHGSLYVARLLVKHKADINAKTTDGRTPKYLAECYNSLLMITFLSSLPTTS